MFGLPLSFLSPWVLLSFAVFPLLWWLLRVAPPKPQKIIFPPLRIFQDLTGKSEESAVTPWPILLLRMLLLSMIIFACAGPLWTEESIPEDSSPLLILVDNGATAAHDWEKLSNNLRTHLMFAEKQKRSVQILPLADEIQNLELIPASLAQEQVNSLKPKAFLAERSQHLPLIQKFIETYKDGKLLWISDGIKTNHETNFEEKLNSLLNGRLLTIEVQESPEILALRNASSKTGQLSLQIIRNPNARQTKGIAQALSSQGSVISEAPFQFSDNHDHQKPVIISFDLPMELKSHIRQFRIKDENSALSSFLLSGNSYFYQVGIVAPSSDRTLQPLLNSSFYVEKALESNAYIQRRQGSPADQIASFIRIPNSAPNQRVDSSVSVIILMDVGTFNTESQQRLTRFVEDGGVLIRFAEPQLSQKDQSTLPVHIREGGRLLGSVMSWNEPPTLAPFPEKSPFASLSPSSDIRIMRQILAEPDADLLERTWASLEDGTPLVTAKKSGKGLIIFFHISADSRWSTLPLSGLFAQMLQNILNLASPNPISNSYADQNTTVNIEDVSIKPDAFAPRLIMDGFGLLRAPSAEIRALPTGSKGIAQREHPAGFYGTATHNRAVNVLSPEDTLSSLNFFSMNATILHDFKTISRDLRVPVLLIAFLLFCIDMIASVFISGFQFSRMNRLASLFRRKKNSIHIFLLGLSLFTGASFIPDQGQAQQLTPLPPIEKGSFEPALRLRLAYVLTGNKELDATSKAGLRGVSRVLFQRTAVEPGEPVGVNLEKDELVFFPIIYWPIDPSNPMPSDNALKNIDSYMRYGGMVIFDTRDAPRSSISPKTEEATYLQKIFRKLTIPPIEPVPAEHVLSKSYYLLKNFPGRYLTGQTWIEALPPKDAAIDISPARGGDSVSPIIISTNDLAAAWAIDERGNPLFPLIEEENRQREYAFRFGVNIVMYALTGNYKTDQVHVPALLERLNR